MAFLPPVPTFPEPGGWIRHWDQNTRSYKFKKLIDWRYPLVYPIRLGSVATGGTSTRTLLQDLDPGDRLDHRFALLIGVRPGALYRVYHPYSIEQWDWDKNPQFITRDLTRCITYEISPYDDPKVMLWVEPLLYPGIEAINVMERASVPEVYIVGAKYKVQYEEAVDPLSRPNARELDDVKAGRIPTMQVSFGGDI